MVGIVVPVESLTMLINQAVSQVFLVMTGGQGALRAAYLWLVAFSSGLRGHGA